MYSYLSIISRQVPVDLTMSTGIESLKRSSFLGSICFIPNRSPEGSDEVTPKAAVLNRLS